MTGNSFGNVVENGMTDIEPSFNAWGKAFSPKKAEELTGLVFTEKDEPGHIGRLGKYKGVPTPRGSAILQPPADVPAGDRILWLAKQLAGKIDRIRSAGAEDIHIWVAYYHEGQCNHALSAEELKALAELDIGFWISCYKTEQAEEFADENPQILRLVPDDQPKKNGPRSRSPSFVIYEQARQAMVDGQLEEAMRLFQETVRLGPHFKAFELLGECLMKLGRHKEAVGPLASAVALNQGVRAPSLLAEAFLFIGDKICAQEFAELALNRDPNNKKAKDIMAKIGAEGET